MVRYILLTVVVFAVVTCELVVSASDLRKFPIDVAELSPGSSTGVVRRMSLPEMDDILSKGDSDMAVMISTELKKRRDPESKDIILRAYDSQKNSLIRMNLAQALYVLDKEKGEEYLKKLLGDSNIVASTGAAAVLSVDDRSAYSKVQTALESEKRTSREYAARTVLMSVTAAPALYEKASFVVKESGDLKTWFGLLYSGPRPEAIEWIRPYTLEPYDESTRLAAIRSITSFKDSTLVLPVLMPLIDDPSEAVAKIAVGHIAFRADRSDWRITPFANSITLEEARKQIKQWWAEESAKAQNPDSVQ